MVFAITTLICFLIFLFILWKFIRTSIKVLGIIIICGLLIATASLLIIKPDMHKPFSINTIEYLIKINDDGSMTTTKQVTKTVIKEKKQEEQK